MREIDPQSEGRLTEALRRLAASSSKGAPPQIGAGLLGEFRHYHARRRRIRRAGILALVVCITLAGAWTLSLRNRQRELGAAKQNESAPVNEAKQTPALPSPVVRPEPKQAVKISPSKPKSTKVVAARAQARSFNRAFLALPGYDPAVPLEDLQVVRVQLPASALWKIGAPVGADAGTRRMTADFVVSQDGTPYAVRLVQ